ncbi:hypothetical protein BS47DRAFT_1305233 [Hydnum rufescens UP504]|uniref:Caffeine-induced death protein 2 n=1 Tax=Hydnum rufescens UP504 TaxID=1448309 RepID=A0A9P6DQC2_9AGAM|nr:hypothetical protein BS47DRAFT_1305233 [Hydnum rufescens UP504]
MAPTRQPVLGSAAIEMPTPQRVRVTESTCLQLSLFKDIMKEYRKLDDAITMRLNRNNAQWRDKDRLGGRLSFSQDDACEHFWKELVANWKGRAAVIDYCVKVADRVVEGKKKAFEGQEASLDAERKFRSGVFGDEVKRNQIRQEITVEAIVRRRSLEAFTSRCKHFEPPRTDVEARKWWDAAIVGLHVE